MAVANNEDVQLRPEALPFLEAICWQTDDVYRFDNGGIICSDRIDTPKSEYCNRQKKRDIK